MCYERFTNWTMKNIRVLTHRFVDLLSIYPDFESLFGLTATVYLRNTLVIKVAPSGHFLINFICTDLLRNRRRRVGALSPSFSLSKPTVAISLLFNGYCFMSSAVFQRCSILHLESCQCRYTGMILQCYCTTIAALLQEIEHAHNFTGAISTRMHLWDWLRWDSRANRARCV